MLPQLGKKGSHMEEGGVVGTVALDTKISTPKDWGWQHPSLETIGRALLPWHASLGFSWSQGDALKPCLWERKLAPCPQHTNLPRPGQFGLSRGSMSRRPCPRPRIRKWVGMPGTLTATAWVILKSPGQLQQGHIHDVMRWDIIICVGGCIRHALPPAQGRHSIPLIGIATSGLESWVEFGSKSPIKADRIHFFQTVHSALPLDECSSDALTTLWIENSQQYCQGLCNNFNAASYYEAICFKRLACLLAVDQNWGEATSKVYESSWQEPNFYSYKRCVYSKWHPK